MLKRITVRTHRQAEFHDITGQVQQIVAEQGVADGVVYVYCPHTTCGLTIQENADPGVQHDMLLLLSRIAPREDAAYRHIEDNSASHLQASAMGFSQMLLVEGGRLVLGRWQALYLTEFDGPRQRTVIVKIVPDAASESMG
jgi:secondary thiamine-phosphate synthase enzyme